MKSKKLHFSDASARKKNLENYVNSIALSHATEQPFAAVTSRDHEAFQLIGTVLVSSTEKLAEDFEELFQKYLSLLNISTSIALVGSANVGFIATKNCLRVILDANNINIQAGETPHLSISERAKVILAATKAATTSTSKKELFLDSFSDSSLLDALQNMLEEEGFFIKNKKQSLGFF